MKALLVAALVLLVIAVPLASADRYTGSLAADAIYLQGATRTQGAGLLTRMGGDGNSFTEAPKLTLTAQRIQVSHEHHHRVVVAGVELGDEVGNNHDDAVYEGVTGTFEAWQAQGSEIVIATETGMPLSFGSAEGQAIAPTPLQVLEAQKTWTLGALRNTGVRAGDDYNFHADAGSIALTGPEFLSRVDYEGGFVIYLFGSQVRLDHAAGTAHYESGYRVGDDNTRGDSWFNLTTMHVRGGHLSLEPGVNAAVAYAPHVASSGTGTVLLQGATGNLQTAGESSVGLDAEDMNLVGDYELAIRGSSRGLVASVAGDFESSLIDLAGANVRHAGANLWWLGAFGLGLVAVSGTGGVLLMRRRQAAQVPATPMVSLKPAEVADARHVDPDFAWDEINEEFGVVHAGEKAGVLIVLVPEERVQSFLLAVVARGLMAEDTGDRVHAGENTLAVVALEPSPVMMN